MKKAFTMLELVFVIVVMGILAAVIMPNTKSNPVQEAAVQLANHIKYTQHLAMTDDRYDPSITWFRDRWQLVFASSTYTGGSDVEAYTIFSDAYGVGSTRGDADEDEVANNPENINQIMTGGYSATAALDYTNSGFKGMKKLNLGKSYGINSVTFSNSCDGSNGLSKRLAFDHLGRPIQGDLSSTTSPYHVATQRLITSNCDINITDGSETSIIRIVPETGFTCILDASGTSCI